MRVEEKSPSETAKEVSDYAKKNGGIDKEDMLKVASLIKKGDIKAAKKMAKGLDTDPRDWLMGKIEKIKEQKEVIEITEDVRVPGTDVILEAGDRIEIVESMIQESRALAQAITTAKVAGWLEAGHDFMRLTFSDTKGLDDFLQQLSRTNWDDLDEFLKGMEQAVSNNRIRYKHFK